MPVSPICLVQDGSGSFVPTAGGVDVTSGDTISIKLSNITGVTDWFLQIYGSDELADLNTISATLTNVDPITNEVTTPSSVVTFTFAPSLGAAGNTLLFLSTVMGPGGPVATTFGIFTLTTNSLRVGAVGQTREGDTNFGWAAITNPVIRNSGVVPNSINLNYGSTVSLTGTQNQVFVKGTAGPGTTINTALVSTVQTGTTFTVTDDAGLSSPSDSITVAVNFTDSGLIFIEDPNDPGVFVSSIAMIIAGGSVTWMYDGAGFWKVAWAFYPLASAGTLFTWKTVLDVDFTAQASQTIAPDGNYTIGGYSWSKQNTASDHATNLIGTFHITNGLATVNTTTSQIGTLAGGSIVVFSDQVSVAYTVLSLTSSVVTLTTPYTGTNDAAASAQQITSPMVVTNGTGLLINPNSASDWGISSAANRTMPLIRLPFSSIPGLSGIDWQTKMRIWLYAEMTHPGDQSSTDGVVIGYDSNNDGIMLGMMQGSEEANPAANDSISTGASFNGSTSYSWQGSNTNSGFFPNSAVSVLQTNSLPAGELFPYLGTYAGGWPDPSTLLAFNANTNADISVPDFSAVPVIGSLGLVIGASNSSSNSIQMKVKRIRLDIYVPATVTIPASNGVALENNGSAIANNPHQTLNLFRLASLDQGTGIASISAVDQTLSVNYGTTTTLSSTAWVLLVGASGSGATTVNAPPVAGIIGTGWSFTVVDSGAASASNNITVSGNGQNIEDPNSPGTFSASVVISVNSASVDWLYDGVHWKLV